MKRLVALVAAAGAVLTAAAMPTKAELRKARARVTGMTAADVAALKSGTKTPAEVAAKHLELAAQAGDEAEKYLLLQGAFKLWVTGEEYEAAADALAAMNREIVDMRPEVIVELYDKEVLGAMKERAPKLYAVREAARRQILARRRNDGTAASPDILSQRRLTFELGDGLNLELERCPAVTFRMSNAPGGPNGEGTHEVKLTRAFWIASTRVTREMYKAFEADYDRDERSKGEKKPDDFVTGYARAEAFAGWLNRRFRSKLPRGYVFRMPSEAEWEHAVNAGVIARNWDFEGTLDTAVAVSKKPYAWRFDLSVMTYGESETDPLRVCSDTSAWVCRQDAKKRFLLRMDGPGCFRMAVGPDLVAGKR